MTVPAVDFTLSPVSSPATSVASSPSSKPDSRNWSMFMTLPGNLSSHRRRMASISAGDLPASEARTLPMSFETRPCEDLISATASSSSLRRSGVIFFTSSLSSGVSWPRWWRSRLMSCSETSGMSASACLRSSSSSLPSTPARIMRYISGDCVRIAARVSGELSTSCMSLSVSAPRSHAPSA